MRSLIEHARAFPARADADGCHLAPLAAGQSPQALFITCSDSRVIPSLICRAQPGELFELRTAGNIVPAYSLDRPTGEAATIEFAVQVLGVADIVVCGHSHCGAVGALVRGDDLTTVPALARWLADTTAKDTGDHAPDAPQQTRHQHTRQPTRQQAGEDAEAVLTAAVQRHVLAQLDRLRGYPAVRARLADGTLALHGWYYQVHTGTVHAHRPSDGTFAPL
ncbi:carbonic anhydrase [Actinomadura miaoliensis]|uniref:Carbonic anhydrase n=1 Tax=Actinomadura miaoliensis TaxID=430685 RepID=A0ABP7VMV2_9ACTN